METKKVAKVREAIKSYNGRNGLMTVHGITIEGDPQEYEYHSASATCEKFKAGEEVTFTTEVKQNGIYTNHKITPIAAQKPFGGGFKGGYAAKDNKDQGIIRALSSVSSAVNYYQQRQGTEDQVMALAEKIFQWATSKANQ